MSIQKPPTSTKEVLERWRELSSEPDKQNEFWKYVFSRSPIDYMPPAPKMSKVLSDTRADDSAVMARLEYDMRLSIGILNDVSSRFFIQKSLDSVSGTITVKSLFEIPSAVWRSLPTEKRDFWRWNILDRLRKSGFPPAARPYLDERWSDGRSYYVTKILSSAIEHMQRCYDLVISDPDLHRNMRDEEPEDRLTKLLGPSVRESKIITQENLDLENELVSRKPPGGLE